MEELKSRKEMDPRYLWRLEDMIPSDEAYDELEKETRERISAFKALESHVKDDPAKAVKDYFAFSLPAEKCYVFASMRRDEDGADPAAQARFARAQQLNTDCATAASFLEPELLSLPEETLKALTEDPCMQDYDSYLKGLMRFKPHSLSAEEEKLMALSSDPLTVSSDAFGMLDSVDLPMPEVLCEDGNRQKLSQGLYSMNLRSRSREVRAEALQGMLGAFKGFRSTISALYAGAVKADLFHTRARKFPNCLEAALFHEQIPAEVYNGLLRAVEEALPHLNRYLSLRKKVLHVDSLHMYDLYVPIVDEFDLKLSYEEAFDLVIKALAPLGSEYTDKLKEARMSGWVDVFENKNKRGGAYSWGCYGTHPYVLLNFTGNLDGASTLAHELGHAMHSFYSDTNQPYAKAQYSLFVAEVASTCNEVLLSRYLMNEYRDDRKAQAFFCNQLLENFRTTLFRQTMFAAFEKRSHEMAENGEPLTADSLSSMYLDLNRLYYGGVCDVDEAIASEWMRIPHFYRNFYVYKYATGFSAAVAIADRILREGESAVKDYKRFLSAGGSVPPIEALRYAGVDMADPTTVKNALNMFGETVEQMEKLL